MKLNVELKGTDHVTPNATTSKGGVFTETSACWRQNFLAIFEVFVTLDLVLVTSDLMQEQPTLEMVSAGSDTHDTSSLKRSFSIRLIRDS